MTTPARYWRIGIRSRVEYSRGTISITTLQLRNAAGNNLSVVPTTTNLFNAGTYPLSHLTDGLNTTFTVWQRDFAATVFFYLTYDFGAGNPVLVDHALFRISESTSIWNSIFAASTLVVIFESSSDGTTWVAQAMHDGPFAGPDIDYRIAANVQSQFFPRPDRVRLGGNGGIYGIVSEDGVALPDRPVVLIDRATLQPIGYATTDINGGYAFNGLNTSNEYMVMSYDPSGPPYKNALIWDRIVPINTLGNIATSAPFWARRARDPNLGSAIAFSDYINGTTYRYFRAATLGTERFVQTHTAYTGFTPDMTQVAAGAFRLWKSGRTPTDRAQGFACYTNGGTFTGVNSAGLTLNFSELTFEYIFKAPSAGESSLIMVYAGTRDSDDVPLGVGNELNWGWGAVGVGPTLEVTTSAMNVRFPLSARNRSTIRATAPVIQGQSYHVMVTYKQDDFIKLYVNGALVQTTAISGGGRLWGHTHRAGDVAFDAWDTWSGHYEGAIRRLSGFYCGGSGISITGNTSVDNNGGVPPGFGGAFGMSALYNRVFTDAQVATFYDSYVNPLTHAVASAQSGYAGEVEADVPAMYLRLNELAAPIRFASPLGYEDYTSTAEATLVYGATGFVSGTTAVTTSAGALLVTGLMPSTFTFECFIRPSSVAGTQRIFLQRIFNAGAPLYLSMVSGVLRLNVVDASGTDTLIQFSHATLVAGTAYHIAVTYDPWTDKQARLYINGVLVSSVAGATLPANFRATWLGIGANVSGTGPTWSERFQGQIGEVAVYQYVLPAARIQAHYDARNA